MPERLPVFAVIPNYNMAESLDKLLAQVVNAGYDEVYLLDDHSTDNSIEVVSKYKNVKVVAGNKNLGPAGNRNRIISKLDKDSVLHFIDADVSLLSKNNPDECRQLFKDDNVGLVGGLITLPDGTAFLFNYGPAFSFYSMVGGILHAFVYGHDKQRLKLAKYTYWWRKEFTDPRSKQLAKEVYWVSEANMVIPSSVFKEVGGFDEALRFHEAQDLAIKLHKKGYRVEFSPEVSVQHPAVSMDLDNDRKRDMNRAHLHIIKKYGFHFRNV